MCSYKKHGPMIASGIPNASIQGFLETRNKVVQVNLETIHNFWVWLGHIYRENPI